MPHLLGACFLGTLVCLQPGTKASLLCALLPGHPPLSPLSALSACRYALNIGFNLQNKTIFNYFPFPWTVSAVHVVVGLVYCTIAYLLGQKKMSFGRVSVAVGAVLGRVEMQGDAVQGGVVHRVCARGGGILPMLCAWLHEACTVQGSRTLCRV